MINKTTNILLLTIIVACFTTGCIPKAEDLNQKTYLFSVPTNNTVAQKSNLGTVQINETTIAAPFADNSFVYRTSDVIYTKDFYNIFFTPPNQQINQILFDKIEKAKIFSNVEHTGALSIANFIITSNVNQLYADYRNRSNPVAVFEINIKLYKQTEQNSRLIFEKTYTQTTSIEPQDSIGLMSAWNADINTTFNQIILDINQAAKKILIVKPSAAKKYDYNNYNTIVTRIQKN